MKKKAKKYVGFSLIEGAVATFIVMVGMLAVVQLMTASLRSSFNSREQQIAVMLSQEGSELVKNVRENNWAQAQGSFSNFPSAGDYRIDAASGTISNSSSKRLYLDNGNFMYTHTSAGSTATKFQRKITLSFPGATAVVTSEVIWNRSNDDFPSLTNCTTLNQCVYTTSTLSKWGE